METNNAGLNFELKVFLLISLLNCTTFIPLEHSRTRNSSQGGFYYVNLINMYIFCLIFPVESMFLLLLSLCRYPRQSDVKPSIFHYKNNKINKQYYLSTYLLIANERLSS